jgi:hypothetical protein
LQLTKLSGSAGRSAGCLALASLEKRCGCARERRVGLMHWIS